MGQMEAPSSWKIVKLVFLRTPTQGHYADINGVQMVRIIVWKKRKNPRVGMIETWEELKPSVADTFKL